MLLWAFFCALALANPYPKCPPKPWYEIAARNAWEATGAKEWWSRLPLCMSGGRGKDWESRALSLTEATAVLVRALTGWQLPWISFEEMHVMEACPHVSRCTTGACKGATKMWRAALWQVPKLLLVYVLILFAVFLFVSLVIGLAALSHMGY